MRPSAPRVSKRPLQTAFVDVLAMPTHISELSALSPECPLGNSGLSLSLSLARSKQLN